MDTAIGSSSPISISYNGPVRNRLRGNHQHTIGSSGRDDNGFGYHGKSYSDTTSTNANTAGDEVVVDGCGAEFSLMPEMRGAEDPLSLMDVSVDNLFTPAPGQSCIGGKSHRGGDYPSVIKTSN